MDGFWIRIKHGDGIQWFPAVALGWRTPTASPEIYRPKAVRSTESHSFRGTQLTVNILLAVRYNEHSIHPGIDQLDRHPTGVKGIRDEGLTAKLTQLRSHRLVY